MKDLSTDVSGQDQAKYLTSNPLVQRLLARWLTKLASLVAAHVPTDTPLLDAGAGAGFSLERFVGIRPVLAVDLHLAKAAQIPERVPTAQPLVSDVTHLPLPDNAVAWATSIEVLEHLPHPELLVIELARVCRDGVIVSVPWEPWFKLGNLARGKNVRRLGNDPEHIGAFGPRNLARLLGQSFDHVTIHRRLPWILAVATGPHTPPR
ncbi:MAG: class I SAM-dependent methyltransferase [Acidimicrobiales bacterium]